MKKITIATVLLAAFALAAPLCFSQSKPDPKAVLDEMVKKAAALKSYKLIFEYEEAVPNKKNVWRKCEFWFMGRDFLRLGVLEGDDKGSKVAYNVSRSKTKVFAKPGMSPVAIPVEKTDKRLEGFFESDWKSDLDEIASMTKSATITLAGEEKVKDRDAWKLDIKTKGGKYDRIILWADKKDKLLLKYEYYVKGSFFARKTWYDIDIDAKFKEKDFKP